MCAGRRQGCLRQGTHPLPGSSSYPPALRRRRGHQQAHGQDVLQGTQAAQPGGVQGGFPGGTSCPDQEAGGGTSRGAGD